MLLQYFATLAGERPLNLQRVNACVKPLIELSGETHYYAAVCARERIIRMQKQLSEKLKSTGALVLPFPKPSFRVRV